MPKQLGVDGFGYNIEFCHDCHSKMACCISCPATYTLNNHDHRNIRKHMQTHEYDVNDDAPEIHHEDSDSDDDNDLDEDNLPSLVCRSVDSDSDEEDELDDYSYGQQEQNLLDDSTSCSSNKERQNFAINEELSKLEMERIILPDYGNTISNTYFQQDYDVEKNYGELFGGIRGITWRSRQRVECFTCKDTVSLDDTEFMFDMTKMLSLNTEKNNLLQYKVMNGIAERTPGNFDSANPHLTIPKNTAEGNRCCLYSKFGIFNNLPCPTIHTVKGHACMKLRDVIAHHLSLGRKIEFTDCPGAIPSTRDKKYHGIHGCQSMKDLLDEMKKYPNSKKKEIYYAWMLTWSDSFLRSYVKQKYNNVWMFTITLPDPGGNATSPFHTYCVAVGAGALDHTSVIDWYAKEVDSLMKGSNYYCASTKKVIHVRFGVVAALADRPEKAFTLKTSLLGQYGKIASWASDIVPDALADCKRCFNKRLRLILKDPFSRTAIGKCNKCCQWNLSSDSKSLKRFRVPPKYPTQCCPQSPEPPHGREVGVKYLLPEPQSFPWLISAVKYAAHNVSAGVWNKGNMVDYLRSCAVAKSVRENLWVLCKPPTAKELANRNHSHVIEFDDGEIDDGEIDDGEIDDGYDPIFADSDEEFQVVPLMWESSLDMKSYIDCAMHLIFHGVLAYCVEKNEDFMKTHGVTPEFEKLVNVHMIDIQLHRLEWCKLKTFPKKQWIAENEIGLARILPFIYGIFFRIVGLPERCNTSVKSRVAMMQLLHTLFVLISMLMSKRNIAGQIIHEHVKIFLSTCHRFCRSYFHKKDTPFWANTGNFPTLLNLGSQIDRFGPVRLYWEGTRERYIQELKKHLVGMRRNPEYFGGKLCLMYRTNVMDWVREEMSKRDTRGNDEEFKREERMYYQYKTLAEIKKRFSCGEVISGFTTGGEDLLIAYGKNRRSGLMNIVKIERMDNGSAMKSMGLAYVSCKLKEKSQELEGFKNLDVKMVEDEIISHFILLPYVETGEFRGLFAVIYDDWDVGDEYFKKSLPGLCSKLFETNVL